MTGFPVLNHIYASCKSRGSLVKLLAVNRDLALAYELITQDYFLQFILRDQRSLTKEELYLMGAH